MLKCSPQNESCFYHLKPARIRRITRLPMDKKLSRECPGDFMNHQYLNRVPLFNMTHPRMQRLPVDSKDLAQNCRKYLSTDKEMKTQQTNPYIKNRTKNLQLKKATQLLTQGQWWSIFRTQFPHIEQWWARSGLIMLHLSQYRTEPQTRSYTSTAVLMPTPTPLKSPPNKKGRKKSIFYRILQIFILIRPQKPKFSMRNNVHILAKEGS